LRAPLKGFNRRLKGGGGTFKILRGALADGGEEGLEEAEEDVARGGNVPEGGEGLGVDVFQRAAAASAVAPQATREVPIRRVLRARHG
jgi:hypothetical protein